MCLAHPSTLLPLFTQTLGQEAAREDLGIAIAVYMDSLGGYLGKRNLVVTTYRAHWWPYCGRQLGLS